MSTGPENTFIGSVHRHLPVGLYRMKNHNPYNGGIPDVWYSGPAADLWVEFKFIVLPKRQDTVIAINLSALQVDWINSRHAEGRNVGVLVGSKNGGVYFPGLSWAEPLNARDFVSRLVDRKTLASMIEDSIFRGGWESKSCKAQDDSSPAQELGQTDYGRGNAPDTNVGG